MFDKNFYPTPKNICRKLLSGIEHGSNILEPSAGKGDILDVYKESQDEYRYNSGIHHLYCIEKNQELIGILRSKGYKLIDQDFLTYKPDMTFQYIVMNPPFDYGYKHFLKAWDISHNTEIRCLLPESHITNPSNKEMELVNKIISENNGTIEYLGDCFSNAERKTNVNVVLIKVKRESNINLDFTFKPKNSNEKMYSVSDMDKNQIASIDLFENLEIRYNKVKELYIELLMKQQEIEYYANGLTNTEILKYVKDDVHNPSYNIEHFTSNFKKDCWDRIFNHTKFNEIVTSDVKKKFHEFQKLQGNMAFNKENIESLFDDLFQNKANIMQTCIEQSFDTITKYHEDNRVHIEGWKTNERYKANIKFILPFTLNCHWNKSISMSYGYRGYSDTILDIEKGLCFISGKKITECNSIMSLFESHKITDWGKWYDSEFFEFKCFKKGTIHFKFKSEELWDKFNVIACKNKNWIGN